MSKRKRVPAELHAEISEYSALLRALRTRDTLDLTSQLIRAHTASQANTEDGLLDGDELDLDEGESEKFLTKVTSQGDIVPSANDAAVRGLKAKHRPGKLKSRTTSRKARDHWTRWPLMAGDVHVPEWTLEDEVKVLAVHHIRKTLSRPDASPEASELLEDLDDDFENTFLPQISLHALSVEAASYLSRVLALVAAFKAPAAESMQNRFAPFGWETIMAAVSSSGLADVNVLQNVQRRMEAIYGSTKSQAVHRARVRIAGEAETRRVMEPYELSFLDWAYRPPPPPKRKRGPYKKRKVKSAETVESSVEPDGHSSSAVGQVPDT